MEQLTIPGVPRRRGVRSLASPPEPPAEQGEIDPRQRVLFSCEVVLKRELDLALEKGAFEEADGVRLQIEASYGSGAAATHAFLAGLTSAFRRGGLAAALAAWRVAADQLAFRRVLERSVRRAFFLRAVATWGAETVAASAPEFLAHVANALAADAQGLAGRRLVRDALLAGRSLLPGDFEDAAISAVLAEDRSPRWLACLGAVQRVWPVEPESGADGLADVPPRGGGQARHFWHWLQVAESRDATLAQVYEARKHLKRLDEELHGLYMRRCR